MRGKVAIFLGILVDYLLGVDLSVSLVFLSIAHKGHEDGPFILVVDENIRIDIFNAAIVNLNINAEEWTQKREQFVSGDEVIQRFTLIHEDEEGSEEVHHDDVHDRV